jgi:biopolymer transport protein ExbB
MLSASSQTRSLRFVCFLLSISVVFGAFSVAALISPEITVAQDGDKKVDKADEAKTATDAKKGTNALLWLVQSLGILYIIVFLLLSFTFVALLVMNLLAARRANVCPTHLVEGFEAYLNEKQYQEAYDLAKADDSFLGHVLSSGLAKLQAGYQPALEAMQEVGEEENMKLQQRLSYLALIGTIAPMVGLFGTVHGMIDAFYEIATSGTTPEPAELANGISKALLTTLLGLAIAIPAIAAFNIMRNWVDRLVLEVGILSEGLMGRFQGLGEKK